MKNCLLKLFNSILTNGSYPTNWKKAFLSPIHKGESLDNPNNYRRISIFSCVAKVFNTILTKRLDDLFNNHNLINPVVGRNTFLSSPHLCFIIVFICDLFVSRDDPLMS